MSDEWRGRGSTNGARGASTEVSGLLVVTEERGVPRRGERVLSRGFGASRPDRGGREALPESQEQQRRALEAKAPSDDRPDQALLLRQDPDPGPAVGGDPQIRAPLVPVLDLYLLVRDHDRGPGLLVAREREVVRRVQPFGGLGLEGQEQRIQEAANAVRPHA